MTELAFMTISDWANGGLYKAEGSQRIRDWIGATPAYLFCAEKEEHFTAKSHRLEHDLTEHLEVPGIKSIRATYADLRHAEGKKLDATLLALIPFKEVEIEAIRQAVEDDTFEKVVVIISTESGVLRAMLRGFGSTNLGAEEKDATADPLLVEAARMMVNEEYNGLGSGNGKGAVLGLIHAFRDAGVSASKDDWLAAYFAAGGKVRHAETVAKYLDEIAKGTKHRYESWFDSKIVKILSKRIERKASAEASSN